MSHIEVANNFLKKDNGPIFSQGSSMDNFLKRLGINYGLEAIFVILHTHTHTHTHTFQVE